MRKIYFLSAVIAAALYAITATAEEPRYPTQGHLAARYLSRWISRAEQRVEAAWRDQVLSREQYERLLSRIQHVRGLARVALMDNLVTPHERGIIRHAIGLIDMDVAEARFGPDKPKPERWATYEPPAPRRAPVESGGGTGTVQGGTGSAQ